MCNRDAPCHVAEKWRRNAYQALDEVLDLRQQVLGDGRVGKLLRLAVDTPSENEAMVALTKARALHRKETAE